MDKEELRLRVRALRVAAIGLASMILIIIIGLGALSYGISRSWVITIVVALGAVAIAGGFTYAIGKYSGYFEASKKYLESLEEKES